MSRYTGPRVKIMRALGVDLPGLSSKTAERRPYPPGQHGNGGRRKYSEYAVRQMETKKLRLNYGLTERQLRRLIEEATRSRQVTTKKLIELVERRLDNVVFRAGFARTIPGARQMVCHGHVLVDGKRVDIASFRVRPEMVVSLKSPPDAIAQPRHPAPEWLDVKPEKGTATVTGFPDLGTLLFELNPTLIIEHYSKRI